MPRESQKLERALRRAFNMLREDARATAKVVVNAFRGEDEVNDEDLDKDLRSLFYTLERENLLHVRRTEYKFEGQTRRAYFWRLRRLDDQAFGNASEVRSREELEWDRVYQELPQDLWVRRPT